MDKKNLINNLESILRTPTAPFHEYLLRKTIIDLLSDCKDTEISTDSFGNLILNGFLAPIWITRDMLNG